MTRYNLDGLGADTFEDMVVSLSLGVIGPGVRAFGAGPDGGREATYRGPIDWSRTVLDQGSRWDGYCVIQAKYRAEPASKPTENAAWLRRMIDKELDDWADEDSRRGEMPKYIIFVTNIELSSVPNTGGLDALAAHINKRLAERRFARSNLKDWKIWHRSQIEALLDNNQNVREAYTALLTTGDVLNNLAAHTGRLTQEQLGPVLQDHTRRTLMTERWVNFDEAGGTPGGKTALERIIIDLPSRWSQQTQRSAALKRLITQGNRVLKPSIAKDARHVILIGGPGQGKTTISRFLAQSYRYALLREAQLVTEAAQVAQDTGRALARIGSSPPRNPRWPFRINLADLADEIAVTGEVRLTRWIADQITKRCDHQITPALLQSWLRAWPWILILDGLDEVTQAPTRRRLIEIIDEFIADADDVDADLLVVVTTRPSGFTERFASEAFAELHLLPLEPSGATAFASLVIRERLADDPERRDTVEQRLAIAQKDPAQQRLMETPLQVMIMSFILERFATLPADRYRLFTRYYEAIYDRELGKRNHLARRLSEHQADINHIHEQIGLILQSRAEITGDANATLSVDELQDLTEARLEDVGHVDEITRLEVATELVQAATQRLVLLVPKEGSVGFEVRSLQEYMAARAICDGRDDEVGDRLQALAASPHWRNTWVFSAGKLFNDGNDHHRILLLDILRRVDDDPARLGRAFPVAPDVAAELIDDGLAAAAPKYQRLLTDITLQALHGPPPPTTGPIGRALLVAAADPVTRPTVIARLRAAAEGTPASRVCCAVIWEAIKSAKLERPHVARRAMLGKPAELSRLDVAFAAIWELGAPADLATQTRITEHLQPQIKDLDLTAEQQGLVEAALADLDHIHVMPAPKYPTHLVPVQGLQRAEHVNFLVALEDEDAAISLELLLQGVSPDSWIVPALVARAVWPEVSRRPIDRRLLGLS
jgi:hypothetical protein